MGQKAMIPVGQNIFAFVFNKKHHNRRELRTRFHRGCIFLHHIVIDRFAGLRAHVGANIVGFNLLNVSICHFVFFSITR